VSLTPEHDSFDLDLDAMRSARAEKTQTPGIKLAGTRLELPPELPLDVLEPLTGINVDIAVLVRQVLDTRRENSDQANEAILDVIVDQLVVNPSLPAELIEAVKTMAARLFGPEGYAHLTTQRLYVKDLGEIAKFVLRHYGIRLGEASPSPDSSEAAGTTPTPTSPGGTSETSETSGDVPAIPAS
jgi:hypothetical protein